MTEAQLEHIYKDLRANHIRVTPQRKDILRYLASHKSHPTVENIYNGLHATNPNMSLATVYNTLNMFVEQGIVIELKNDEKSHYDFFGRPHFHAICDNCGKITDIFDTGDLDPTYVDYTKQLADKATKDSGYLITSTHIEVHGLCPDCQRKLHISKPQI